MGRLWLSRRPLCIRSEWQKLLMFYKSVHGIAPHYLQELLLLIYRPTHSFIFPRTRMSLFHWSSCATWLPSKSLCTAGKLLCRGIIIQCIKKQIGVSVFILRVYHTSLLRASSVILIWVAALYMTSCCLCN